MTFGFIEAEKASFPISRMCRALGVSQSGSVDPRRPNLVHRSRRGAVTAS